MTYRALDARWTENHREAETGAPGPRSKGSIPKLEAFLSPKPRMAQAPLSLPSLSRSSLNFLLYKKGLPGPGVP